MARYATDAFRANVPWIRLGLDSAAGTLDPNGLSQIGGGVVATANADGGIHFSTSSPSGPFLDPDDGSTIIWPVRDLWGNAFASHITGQLLMEFDTEPVGSAIFVCCGLVNGNSITGDTLVWGGLDWASGAPADKRVRAGNDASFTSTATLTTGVTGTLGLLFSFGIFRRFNGQQTHLEAVFASPLEDGVGIHGGSAGNVNRNTDQPFTNPNPSIFLGVSAVLSEAGTHTTDVRFGARLLGPQAGNLLRLGG